MQRHRRNTIVEHTGAAKEGPFAAICGNAQKAWTNGIPHEYVRLLENHNKIFYGGILYALIFFLGAGIFVYLFLQSLNKVYLSPDPATNCVSVDRPVTGTFYGDLNGHWSGTRHFDPSRAAYTFSLQNFSSSAGSVGLAETGDDMEKANIVTLEDLYRRLMGSIMYNGLSVLKPIMQRQNYADNLLYLMMWSLSTETGESKSAQTFSFSGSPLSVFESLGYQAAGLGGPHGLCSVLPTTTLDSANQQWVISWKYSDFVADANCVASMPPSALGWVKGIEVVEISVDLRSFFAAAAANTPPPPVKRFFGNSTGYENTVSLYQYNWQLKEVFWKHDDDHYITLGSPPRDFYIAQYFDSRYPGMQAIFCITPLRADRGKSSSPPPANNDDDSGRGDRRKSRKTCFINAGGALFALPIFDHTGANNNIYNDIVSGSFVSPEPCRCNLEDGGPSSDVPSNCLGMDFLSSLLFFPLDMLRLGASHSHDDIVPAMIAFLQKQSNFVTFSSSSSGGGGGPASPSLAEQAFEAAWLTAPHLTYSPNSTASYEYLWAAAPPSYRRSAFSFCQTAFGGCSLLSLRATASYSMFSRTYKASPSYFSFTDGACNFTLIEEQSFSVLAQTPPVSLEQGYYRCVPRVVDTFALSFGVALSDTTALAPLIALAFVGCLLLFQWFTGRPWPRAFSAEEKGEVLGLLATRMLLLQRGHHPNTAHGPASSSPSSFSSSSVSGAKNDDPLPAPLVLAPAPTVLAIAQELEIPLDTSSNTDSSGRDKDKDKDKDSSPLQRIFICDKPSTNSPARRLSATIERCCSGGGGGGGARGVGSTAAAAAGAGAEMTTTLRPHASSPMHSPPSPTHMHEAFSVDSPSGRL
jgi:hypothetical protein